MMRKKRPPDHKSIIQLTKRYADAESKLRTILFDVAPASIVERKQQIDEVAISVQKSLTKANREFAKSLNGGYKVGTERVVQTAAMEGIAALSDISTKASGLRAKEAFKTVRRGAFIDLQSGMQNALAGLRHTVAQTIRSLDDKHRNLWDFTNAIENKLRENNILEVRYENGAHIRLDHYAKMLARSSRIETENLGSFAAAERLGTDLVQCIGQSPTCEICAIYSNRIFSISGKDKRFPALYDGENAPLRNGYHLIHPHCRCEFMPYFEDVEGAEQVQKDIAFSNRPFTDSRTKQERDAYAEWQAGNRQLWAEQSEYEQMQHTLGDEMPYKTLGGFRRAKRDFHDAKIDNTANLRYNKFAQAKRSYKTITTIRKKGATKKYSPDYIDKMERTYHEFRANGIELVDHSINRFLGQKIGRGKRPFSKDDVIFAYSKPPNYVQEDGREVHFYNGVAVIVKPETGEVVSIISRDKGSTAWKPKQ